MPLPQSMRLSPLSEAYALIRSQVEREDELIYHRISWLLTTQTILFAAYSVLLAPSPVLPSPSTIDHPETAYALITLIPVIGLIVSVVNYVATLAAIAKVDVLWRVYAGCEQKESDFYNDMPLPELTSGNLIHFWGLLPARTLAPLFYVAWWSLECVRHAHDQWLWWLWPLPIAVWFFVLIHGPIRFAQSGRPVTSDGCSQTKVRLLKSLPERFLVGLPYAAAIVVFVVVLLTRTWWISLVQQSPTSDVNPPVVSSPAAQPKDPQTINSYYGTFNNSHCIPTDPKG